MVDGARPHLLCSEIRASTLSVAAKLHTMSNKYQKWSGLRTLITKRSAGKLHTWDVHVVSLLADQLSSQFLIPFGWKKMSSLRDRTINFFWVHFFIRE